MKKASFILVSIILLSCNGNNSVRNQEYADVDSAVIDTMDVPTIGSSVLFFANFL